MYICLGAKGHIALLSVQMLEHVKGRRFVKQQLDYGMKKVTLLSN